MIRLAPKDKLYWIKVALAFLLGLISSYFWINLPLAAFWLLIAAVSYYVLSKFSPYILRSDYGSLGGRRGIYLEGLGTYIVIFIMTWILFYNMIVG